MNLTPYVENLRREIPGRADDPCRGVPVTEPARHAEVSNVRPAVFVEKNVLRLEVAVDELVLVDVLHRVRDPDD